MLRSFSVAITEPLERQLRDHLDREDGQEDLCFATWTNLTGETRDSAILTSAILPNFRERDVHGNVAFSPEYLMRAVSAAVKRGEGLAFMHSHLGPGWQGMSNDDIIAESRIAPTAFAATGRPLVALTSGTDGAWSARKWVRTATKLYERLDAESARVVGDAFRITHFPRSTRIVPSLERTVSVWGKHDQERIARTRVAVVGLGSVGSVVAEGLARMGLGQLTFVDHDAVEQRNLDRLTNASAADIGKPKVDVAAAAARRFATGTDVQITVVRERCDDPSALRALLDCDVIFCCVDRPWPRRILNQVAMAAVIPVVDAGILVRTRGERFLGADAHVHIVGPGRRCLQCWKAFDPSEAGMDRDGLLDDPSYIRQFEPEHRLLATANVFPFSLAAASLALLQFTAMTVGPIHNLGDQNMHFATGRIDITIDKGCREDCPYAEQLATGDRGLPPTRSYESN